MNEAIKVSVLISTYNHERYIDQCLESVMNQTLREIEIIVVDDCSTDSTLSHIDAAAEKDSRIHVIRHEVNRGACRARKSAVLASRGEYVMLVDGDDWIEPDTCERLSAKMQETGVDILHFGTVVENCANYSPQAISEVEADIAPYLGGMLTESIITEAFLKSRFQNYSVKIFRGKLLRTVYAEIDDGYYIYLEDFYQTFCLLLRSKSYLGIEDRFYHYCYGRGLLGLCRNSLSLQNFQKYCNCADVYRAIQRRSAKWVAEANEEERRLVPPEDLNAILAAVQQKFVKFLLGIFFMRVNPEDQPNGYLMMEQAWQMGGPGFVGLLAQYAWGDRAKIAEAISGATWLKFERRPIRTIGFYYCGDKDGEAKKAIARLASLLTEAWDESGKPKYRVVLIGDEASNEEDYPVSPPVIREQLPPCHENTAEKYASRAEKWQEIIVRNGIDAVFYSYWLNPCLLWDLLSIKRSERYPAFVLQTHPTCAQQNGLNWIFVKELLRIYSLTDGVVTLSETDRLDRSRCDSGSVYIPNPDFVKASGARWISLIESLEKGDLPNAPRLDEATEALLDEIDDNHARALDNLARERDQEHENARRLEAERESWETERRSWETQREAWAVEREAREANREALEKACRFWETELYATRNTVSFRVGRVITWLPRKLRGGVRYYREHGGKYTFYRLLYHLHLAPNNDGSGAT